MDNDVPDIPDDTEKLPDHVREGIAEWFDKTTNEQRIEWANEAGAHPTLQRMMRVRDEVQAERENEKRKRLQQAREKEYDDLTREEKLALVEAGGAAALGEKMNEGRETVSDRVEAVRNRME